MRVDQSGQQSSQVNSPHHVSTGCSLPGNLLVVEGGDPGTEPAVVRVIVTALLLSLLQQPGPVPAHGLVPGGHVVLEKTGLL